MKMNFSNKIWDMATDIESNTYRLIAMMTDIEQDRAGSIKELDALLESIVYDARKIRTLIR